MLEPTAPSRDRRGSGDDLAASPRSAAPSQHPLDFRPLPVFNGAARAPRAIEVVSRFLETSVEDPMSTPRTMFPRARIPYGTWGSSYFPAWQASGLAEVNIGQFAGESMARILSLRKVPK